MKQDSQWDNVDWLLWLAHEDNLDVGFVEVRPPGYIHGQPCARQL
jgi:hypothetical protein